MLTDTQKLHMRHLELTAQKMTQPELIELVMSLANASVERDNQLKEMFQHPWFSGLEAPGRQSTYSPQQD